MSGTHARLAPSAAHKWLNCPAALAEERGKPDVESEHSREGTAAHEVAALCLTDGRAPSEFVGFIAENGYTVREEHVEPITTYVDTIRKLAEGNTLLVERRVDMSDHVPGCYGTADAIIIAGTELQVHDLKFGRGVRVDAEHNPQLMLYALGALPLADCLADIHTARVAIHQPRLSHVSEWVCSRADLLAFAMTAGAAARHAQLILDGVAPAVYEPGEKTCRWCKAKATCEALAETIADTVGLDFDDLTQAETPAPEAEAISVYMAKVELVEQWARAVRAETERQLLAGRTVPGWKLVEGRAGPRKWLDEEAAEALAKASRLKFELAYTASLMSPTQLEKSIKKLKPRVWQKFGALITRTEPSPSVAPESDKREAYVVAWPADSFDDTSKEVTANGG